ncbi:MAG: hypothetical protein HZA91_13260 [Verrucomicrobia bacterium]|nr:hypothetical protein [Verrucomicrobiota bacterium]
MIGKRIEACEAGASVVEYALMLALVALVSVIVMRFLSSNMTQTMDSAGSQMTRENIPNSAPAAPER